jgi:hypothetical protein
LGLPKENSSLKQELDLLKQELKNTKFRLEKVEKEGEKEPPHLMNWSIMLRR